MTIYIHSTNDWIKKIFITPPVAAAQIIFADVRGFGSNCNSTTNVDRVALILEYSFQPKRG